MRRTLEPVCVGCLRRPGRCGALRLQWSCDARSYVFWEISET